jgi:hypothetical protein
MTHEENAKLYMEFQISQPYGIIVLQIARQILCLPEPPI